MQMYKIFFLEGNYFLDIQYQNKVINKARILPIDQLKERKNTNTKINF